MQARTLALAVAISGTLAGWAADTWAHALLTDPPPRDKQDGYKPTRSPNFVLPCGIGRGPAQPITRLQAGATVTVKWSETVYHPGCYLIEFAKSDNDPFQRLTTLPNPPATTVPRPHQAQVTLPGEPCTGCVLRLRQYMAMPCPPAKIDDLSPNFYYSCGNIELQGPGGGDAGMAVADSGAKDVGSAGTRDTALTTDSGSTSGGTAGNGGSAGTSGTSTGSPDAAASAMGGKAGSGGAAGAAGATGGGSAGSTGGSGEPDDSGGAAGAVGARKSGGGCAIGGDGATTGLWALLVGWVVLKSITARRTDARSRSAAARPAS